MATQELDEFAPVKAVKAQVPLKLASQGPSGSGKTEGALAFATNFLIASGKNPAVDRILNVDTENKSASLYADKYDFDTIYLKAPYTSERYKKAMQRSIDGKYAFLIVDGITQQWSGDGGILRRKDKMDAQPNANGWANWSKFDPEYESFVEFIKQIPIDTLVTVRTKQSYVLEVVKGKQVPRKIGMAPIQRDGMEYEYSIVFETDMAHKTVLSKSRLRGVFEADEVIDMLDPDVAIRVREWRDSGAEMIPVQWKPDLTDGNPKTEAPAASKARPPLLLAERDRLFFWKTAKDSGNTDEQIAIWLRSTLNIDSSKKIPAGALQQIMDWAHTPAKPQVFALGEEKARDAAKLMKLTESDIQDELTQAGGDWEKVYASISSAADLDAFTK